MHLVWEMYGKVRYRKEITGSPFQGTKSRGHSTQIKDLRVTD